LIRCGDPATELVRTAQTQNVDLIAMSTHGHRFLNDRIRGATADEVRHLVKVPVLLLKAQLGLECEMTGLKFGAVLWLHEAAFFKSVLDAAGIEAVIPNEQTLGVQPLYGQLVGGVRVLVRESDRKQAARLLDSASPVGHAEADESK